MKLKVSVDKAIQRGHLMVNVPVVIVLAGSPLVAVYLNKQGEIPGWGIGVGTAIGFLLAWLVWSYTITKWRIWAYENVRNVHELKKRAIRERLIWPDGHFFERTEIKSADDKLTLKKLEKKFEIPDEHTEDHSLPSQLEVYYSKPKSYLEIGLGILFLGVALYLRQEGSNLPFYFLLVVSVVGLFKGTRKALNNKPQLILDHQGITARKVGFLGWSEVQSEEVIRVRRGKNSKTFLTFYHPSGQEEINIESYNISRKELNNALKTYRLRWEKMQ